MRRVSFFLSLQVWENDSQMIITTTGTSHAYVWDSRIMLQDCVRRVVVVGWKSFSKEDSTRSALVDAGLESDS